MKRVDSHWDTPMFLRSKIDLPRVISQREPKELYSSLEDIPRANCDYKRMRKYMDIAFFALYFPYREIPLEKHFEVFSERLNLLLADIKKPESGLRVLLDAKHVDESGSFALISAEGGDFLGGEDTAAKRLDEVFLNGLRALGLTWNNKNTLAGGCGEHEWGGITELGQQVIGRCNELGILLDGAHLCTESLLGLVSISDTPVTVSHTCCAALYPDNYPRNISDDGMRAVAKKGGVIGICFASSFLGDTPGISRIAEHIRHAVDIAGIDHVGIGSDFDGCKLPDDIAGLQSMPLIYDELRRSGFTENETEKIAGRNFCRLLKEVLPYPV